MKRIFYSPNGEEVREPTPEEKIRLLEFDTIEKKEDLKIKLKNTQDINEKLDLITQYLDLI